MNLYEHTIIARQDISPSQIKNLKEKYSKIIEENKGNLVQTQEWGLLNLSYLIKKNKKGNYIHFKIKADGKIISPYGSKEVSDPDREVALFSLKKLFNQVSKDILSIDMNACMNYRMDENNIKAIKNINILIGEMDKLVSEKKIDEMIGMFGSAHLKKWKVLHTFHFLKIQRY